MTTPGERQRQAEHDAKAQQAKWAKLRQLEQAWEERQTVLLRGQQRALKADFYARHPELACPHDRQSGRLRLTSATVAGSVECDDCGTHIRHLDETPYTVQPRLGAPWAA